MMRSPIALLGALAAAVALSACSEKPQTATSRKADDKPWDNANAAYVAAGFKAGDAAAWETQLRVRGQAQNEYNRTQTAR
ncbi:hypothetical protein [Aquabacterium sp. OR-4]|uniref:hypothetical protein n=1 Tax=Aquabacterium sp. OR-4 TaxID=2978127 RepID=UPI0021B1AA52|nr:hypothetical protein [Aquabacterium sp. OR-4]MDT7838685.1 hypothetical protein [Aquabacterium sp. OR-4]